MVNTDKKRPGCFRFGCCGCLLLILVSVVGLLGMAGMQTLYERSSGPLADRSLQRDLPAIADYEALVASGEIAGQQLELAGRGSFDELTAASGAGLIRVEFDMDFGEFTVEPGEPGRGVEIDARYDERALRLEEEFTPDAEGGGVLKIRAAPAGGRLGLIARGAGGGPKNFVTVRLPPDVPFELAGDLGLGEAKFELGGLLIRSVDLNLGTGDHRISFGEPLLAPMASVRITKGIGGFHLTGLGNASPERVSVTQRVGELDVDLTGAWANDAQLDLANTIGEITIDPPTTARLETLVENTIGERTGAASNAGIPDTAPVVAVRVRSRVGSVEIHQH